MLTVFRNVVLYRILLGTITCGFGVCHIRFHGMLLLNIGWGIFGAFSLNYVMVISIGHWCVFFQDICIQYFAQENRMGGGLHFVDYLTYHICAGIRDHRHIFLYNMIYAVKFIAVFPLRKPKVPMMPGSDCSPRMETANFPVS